jgi:outer membrane protein TolC
MRVLIAAFSIFCFTASPAAAEVSGEKINVQISTVLESALKHHPLIAEAIAKIDAAQSKLLSARGGFDPVVSLKSRYYGSGYYEGSNSTASLLTVPLETASTDLFLGGRSGNGDFPIYEDEYDTLSRGELGIGFRVSLLRGRDIDDRRTAISMGAMQLDQQHNKADYTKLLVLEEAALAYWEWNVNKAQLVVYNDLLNVSETRQGQFEEKVKLGQLAAVEALDNSRTILSRRQKLLEQQQKIDKSSQKLSLFFRNSDGSPRDVSTVKSSGLPKIKGPQLNTLTRIEAELKARPDILALESELAQHRQELNLAENSMLPKLDLETSLTRDYGVGELSRAGSEWKSMVVFEAPLYRREARGKVQELEFKIRATQEKIRMLKDEVFTYSSAIIKILERSRERYNILQQEVDLSVELEKAELEKFKAGASNLMLVAIREIATATVRADLLENLLINRAAYLKLSALSNNPAAFQSE